MERQIDRYKVLIILNRIIESLNEIEDVKIV